ncbi:transitional endoplasmic reticulum ATPase [Rhodoblastus sphagnicola]|nr:AAA family ATPase [Rhodoblastus sphagnicola]MBB4200729.1 transitional endoplasmic reticulum ATPase [Rhodoblastus sphagnicola]
MSAKPDSVAPDPAASPALILDVHEGRPSDSDRGIVRLDPEAMRAMGAATGDILRIQGARCAHGRAMPSQQQDRGRNLIALDGVTRENAATAAGAKVRVSLASAAPADRIALTLHNFALAPSPILLRQIARAMENAPLATGDGFRIALLSGKRLAATIGATRPAGVVLVGPRTQIVLERGAASPRSGAGKPDAEAARDIRYDDLGGLKREVARVREMIEWPLRHPEIFSQLGIEAPKGVLLSGPPGTGKTLLAKAVATECDAAFFQINGPEIISKHYGESEEHLRSIFQRAGEKAPSVIFIDEIDAIAPKRESLAGDRQVERRIVAQLLTLMDGVKGRGQVIVMAATNLPSSIDPALRRPGRFDREIVFAAPDRPGRREILDIHTRGMPLDGDVDLERLSEITHGYVGADLGALAREAGMAAIRRLMAAAGPEGRFGETELKVTDADFATALNEVGPSAIRELASDIPNIGFDAIGGLDDIKDILIEAVVWPLRYPHYFSGAGLKSAGGVLLHGAPGTGKTLLAKALAHESGVNFIAVRGPQLLNPYIGESEKAVRDLFAKARLVAPTIIFFDEIDALAPRRGAGDAAVERVVTQLLTEMDGIDERRGVFVLAATNRPEAVDPALLRPGRLDRLLEVRLPDAANRARIFKVHLARRKLAETVDIAGLAESCAGFSGAEIEAVCQMAALAPVRRAIKRGGDEPAGAIEADDMSVALACLHAMRSQKSQEKNVAP